ncbi:MAG: diguanylate cyclase, partial [Gammaproteobacteria bacterium]|nr:diguanylate cyclase [Gammaproteobacteria bacterium]
ELKADLSNKEKFLKKFSDRIFLLAISLIILLAAFSFYQFNKLNDANKWVNHTYAVVLTATNSIYLYNYLESKQREYLLFNDKDALQYFYAHVNKMNATLRELMNITADNSIQVKRIQSYRQLINERLALFNQAISLKQTGKYTDIEKNKLFSQGKILSREINNISQEIIDQEQLLLEERNDKLINGISSTDFIVLLGQILSVIFLLIEFFVSRAQFHRRLEIENNRKTLMIQLKSIIEGANDMIVAIDYHYRFLIFNEVYRREFKKLFDKEIVLGKSIEETLADQPEIKNKLLNNWEKSLMGETAVKTLELPIKGVMNTYEITPSLIKTEDGIILGALHIIRNITERIKEKNELRNSYDKLNIATEELKTKNNKITLLLEMSDILLVTDSVEELNTIVPNYCNKILNFSSGNFYIMHPSKDILEISGHWGNPVVRTDIFKPNQCWSLRLGRIHHSALKSHELLCQHVKIVEDKEIGYVCLALRAKNEVFGLLYIEYDIANNKRLSDTEKLLMNAFAEVMALALANARLRDNLRYQSIRDPLTTLYNRRYLEEFLTNQLFLAEREHIPLTVLILDLDHFKRINDIHGHDAGDIVLKEFSHLLVKFIRRSDLATRFGGEEFVVVLFNANKKKGRERADEIRQAVNHLSIKYGNQDVHITVSIGMASFPENAQEGKELIELADKALYTAKRNGRNRVVHYDDAIVTEKNAEKEEETLS